MSNQSFDESPTIARIFDDPGRTWTPIQCFNVKRELAQPERLHHLLLIARRRLGGGATVQDAEDALGKYWESQLDADIDKYDPAKGLRFWRFVCKWFGWFCQTEGKGLLKRWQREVSLIVEDGEGDTIELEFADEHAGHDPEWVVQQKQFLALLNR